MSDTDMLLKHLREAQGLEVDHAIDVYIEPGNRLIHRDTRVIEECGYRIQDVSQDERVRVRLVEDDE